MGDNSLEDIFHKISGEDNKVDRSELKGICEQAGMSLTDEQVVEFMKLADPDGSGYIDLIEFKRLHMFKSVFEAFDTDKSGTVLKSEMAKMCQKLKIKLEAGELDQMMKEADSDGDGHISFGEFVVIVTAQMSSGGKFAEAFHKAVAKVEAAKTEGATWVTGLNPLAAAAKLAKASKPKRRAFLGAPTNASYDLVAEMGTPPDATCYEKTRDQVLGFFVRLNRLFMILAVISALCIVGFGVTIAIMMFSAIFGLHFWGLTTIYPECANQTQSELMYMQLYPEANASTLVYEPADHNLVDRVNGQGMHGACTEGQHWFNICIKVFTIIFSYINLLPVPWRVAIFVDAVNDHRRKDCEEPVGVDFYGRPTEALWFHLPLSSRMWVALCLNIGWIAHYCSLGTHIRYWDYWQTQSMPGIIAVNLPFAVSILLPIAGGIIQGQAESKVIAAQPKRFPPTFGKYLQKAWAKYKADLQMGQISDPGSAAGRASALWCAGFFKHLRDELAQMKKEQEEFESLTDFTVDNMSGIMRKKTGGVATATSTTEPTLVHVDKV